MRLLIVLRPEASLETEETRDDLDTQQSGLGQVFLDRLNELLHRIETTPNLYAVVWKDVRAARLRRFPISSITECISIVLKFWPFSMADVIQPSGSLGGKLTDETR